MDAKETILSGRAVLGVELGSTRIKAVLIDEAHTPIASGDFEWANALENGVWTYALADAEKGLQACYQKLKADALNRYGARITALKGLGVSAMMHGYLAFDKQGALLVPFRTWRNTMTEEAAARLTERFSFNIPQRWSIAHLYQAMLNGEPHVKDIARITTLAGWAHERLSGRAVLGVGDASGMFPIDDKTGDYDARLLDSFDRLAAEYAVPWRIRELLPKVLSAGEDAGTLTASGALLLDPSGELAPGALLCPPEGDAGTGMAATNSVAPRTGNVSAGTSIFAMVTLDKPLKGCHREIDVVTTPAGCPVAMVHCNNCTSDVNAWVGLFSELGNAMGAQFNRGTLFETLYKAALDGEKDGGGLLSYGFPSGEPVVGLDSGRPMLLRLPDAQLTLPNFMRANLYSSLAALKIGMDILFKEENVPLHKIYGHGGFFKTRGVGQKLLAAALNAPVSVMETAGEGGAWGIALLAAYRAEGNGEPLDEYLDRRVFAGMKTATEAPDPEDVKGFDAYIERFKACLPAEKAAAELLH